MNVRSQKRFRSTRAYRRTLDQLTAQASRGEISWAEVAQAATVIKASCEMLMAENLLKISGVSDNEAPEHDLGEDGGLDDYRAYAKATVFRKQRTEVTRGTNSRGDKVDMVKVTTEEPASDE